MVFLFAEIFKQRAVEGNSTREYLGGGPETSLTKKCIVLPEFVTSFVKKPFIDEKVYDSARNCHDFYQLGPTIKEGCLR